MCFTLDKCTVKQIKTLWPLFNNSYQNIISSWNRGAHSSRKALGLVDIELREFVAKESSALKTRADVEHAERILEREAAAAGSQRVREVEERQAARQTVEVDHRAAATAADHALRLAAVQLEIAQARGPAVWGMPWPNWWILRTLWAICRGYAPAKGCMVTPPGNCLGIIRPVSRRCFKLRYSEGYSSPKVWPEWGEISEEV